MAFGGIGVGFGYVPPNAMASDAIEYDALRSGERKEGAFYGMWTFSSKFGIALAVFLSGIILDRGGYIANTLQGEKAIFAIQLIIGPIPALILLGAMILIQFYPLDEAAYKKLLSAGQGDSGRPSTSPPLSPR
jgi:GPH family glycoside/pentoside/hexuronide:cation symporter